MHYVLSKYGIQLSEEAGRELLTKIRRLALDGADVTEAVVVDEARRWICPGEKKALNHRHAPEGLPHNAGSLQLTI